MVGGGWARGFWLLPHTAASLGKLVQAATSGQLFHGEAFEVAPCTHTHTHTRICKRKPRFGTAH